MNPETKTLNVLRSKSDESQRSSGFLEPDSSCLPSKKVEENNNYKANPNIKFPTSQNPFNLINKKVVICNSISSKTSYLDLESVG